MEIEKILIDKLPATSSITTHKLKSLGINSYFDLLNYFPTRYEDYSIVSKINRIQVGEVVTIIGKIIEAKNQYTRSRITIQKIVISDDTGVVEVNWFNQPYLIRVFKIGEMVSVSGIVKQFGAKISIDPKEYEIIFDRSNDQKNLKHTGKIVPIYSEKRGLSTKTVRDKIFFILNSVVGDDPRVVPVGHDGPTLRDPLPPSIIKFNHLIDEDEAYKQIHFPDSLEMADKARERLAFDELFNLQLANNLVKKEWKKERVGNVFKVETRHALSLQDFIANLPFKLTSDQTKVIDEIISDLKKTTPMNRFLQGDVGSGKTIVATIACYLSYLNGYQSIFMAPTEILAQQHFQSISKLFERVGIKPTPTIKLITGSTKKLNSVETGHAPSLQKNQYDIIIGTHALLSKKTKFNKVGLVVIDEQHRFGVEQRALLKEKSLNPHILTMTATPIPRTVALTLYGELDLSYIEEMPAGRQIIKTFLVPKEKRTNGYEWIKKQIKENKSQVFIVCPLIEESENETMKSLKAVRSEFEKLKKIFSDVKTRHALSLLHGRMKSIEKNKVMDDFKNKKIDILVSTPVVEVGIDIPDATVMLIEGADRFGLAQLHQLRGRVGRSNRQSYCLLFTENTSEKTISRLKYFCKNNLGTKLAEFDLKNRGAGNIFGVEQHGFVNLKIANLGDFEMIEKTKKAVEYFMEKYDVKDWGELKIRLKKFETKQISKD